MTTPEPKIIHNRARCRQCNTIVESTHRHHLAFCTCGKIYVDGGRDYLRRGGELQHIEELSEFEEAKYTDTDSPEES